MKNPEKEKKRNKKIAYVGFCLRILMGVFAVAIIVLFVRNLTGMTTDHPYLYAGVFLVIALVVVFGDLYMHYKLDIKPFRKAKN